MIKTRRRQNGDMLISLSLSLIGLIVISVMIGRYMKNLSYESRANVTLNRIENVVEAMQRAYLANVIMGVSADSLSAYPSNGTELIDDGYLETCDADDELNGYCINKLKLPWVDSANDDELIDISTYLDASDGYPAFELSFSLSNVFPVKQRNIIRAKLAQLPNYTEDSSNEVTISFTRPGSELSLENLVRRDGSTTMTGDWDYGGYYLDDVGDISFTDVTDRTALTGSIKLGSIEVSGSSGTDIDKQSCPTGYQAEIEVWTQSLGTTTVMYNIKAFSSWYENNTDTWTLHIRSTAETSDGTKTYFYQGTVAYATWCDFS